VISCIVSRCSPPIRASYEDHREDLRSDFVFSCAYCSTTEIEARGFGFEIDHYQPQLHGGKDDYVNLYWSCRNCNRKKDSYWPAAAGAAAGKTIIRVDHQDPADHFDVAGGDPDSLSAKTSVGECTATLLDLNSQRMRRLRSIRRQLSSSTDFIAHGLRRLGSARTDQLSPEQRALVISLGSEFARDEELTISALRSLVNKHSKSELIDPDPEEAERTQSRRKYLAAAGAMPMRRRRRT